jgi:hypothetical protein
VEIPVSDVDGGSKQWAAGSAIDEPSVTLVESCNLMPITWDRGLIRNVRCVLELVSYMEVVDVIERFQRQRVGGEEDNFVIAVPDGMAVHGFDTFGHTPSSALHILGDKTAPDKSLTNLIPISAAKVHVEQLIMPVKEPLPCANVQYIGDTGEHKADLLCRLPMVLLHTRTVNMHLACGACRVRLDLAADSDGTFRRVDDTFGRIQGLTHRVCAVPHLAVDHNRETAGTTVS